jgi:hypothetical protein
MLGFLIPMAGTRNILVHSYDKIDDSIIYGILKKHLSKIMNFIDVIQSNYRAYVQFRGSEFHTRNARFQQPQEQRRAKAQR